MVDRVPPQCLEIERAVLSNLLAGNERAIDAVMEKLSEQDFYPTAHKEIFKAAQALYSQRKPIDLLTISDSLSANEQIDIVGGTPYLSELVEQCTGGTYIEHHCGRLRDASKLRALITVAQRSLSYAYAPDAEASDVLSKAQSEMYDIGVDNTNESYLPVGRVVEEVAAEFHRYSGGAITGTPTGFDSLDQVMAGIHPGELTLLAARPSMGKTSFATTVAANLCAANRTVLFFSLETPRNQLVMRMVCANAGISMHSARLGKLGAYQVEILKQHAHKLAGMPLCICDSFAATPMQVMAQCRRFVREYGQLDLVVVDYLQLMRPSARQKSRELEVASMGRELKCLANEMSLPVWALCQLNRSVEQSSRRPQKSDLRESGALEQDADNILFIHHGDEFNREAAVTQALIIVDKQRNGPCRDITVMVEPRLMRWRDTGVDTGVWDDAKTPEVAPPWSD